MITWEVNNDQALCVNIQSFPIVLDIFPVGTMFFSFVSFLNELQSHWQLAFLGWVL